MKRLLLLGGGTAGSMMANKLVPTLPPGWTVTVVDRDDLHVYQPGLLFLPFGQYRRDEVVRPRMSLLHRDVERVLGDIDTIDPAAKVVALADGTRLSYDILVIATGSHPDAEATDGLTGRLWRQSVFDFYTLDGAMALAAALERFEGGRLVVNLVDMPIKCPVAPLEFAFLADAFLTKRGLRGKTEITYVTPLDGAFTKPVAARLLGGMMNDRNIKVEAEFGLSHVDNDASTLVGYDGRQVPFDLLVSTPLHTGAAPIQRSGLGDDLGFVPTHKHTLQSLAYDDIFVIGDATNLPTSKAGAVAHFQGDVLHPNLLRYIDGRELLADFDGHANCFIETGHGKAMLLDFNYDTEPLPGRFPLPGVGPFTLLEESAINHWGKLAFKFMYWQFLVKGKDLPLEHRMNPAGKRREVA